MAMWHWYQLSEAGTQEMQWYKGQYYKVMTFICRGCINPVTGQDAQVQILVVMQIWSQWTSFIKGNMLSVDGDADAAVQTRIQIGWNKFRQLVPFFNNKDISLSVRGRFYSSCMRNNMLHGSETWPVRKENEVALQRAEMRMVRWMCGIKLQDRVPSKRLRERL